MDHKTIVKLRGWMRKYGYGGILLAGGYLALHHLYTRRRAPLILSAVGCMSLGTVLLWLLSPQAVRPLPPPAPVSQPTPTTPARDLNAVLLEAVRHDDFPRVKAALAAGAEADASDPVEYYTLVTRHEADYNVPLSHITGETALGIAVQHRQPSIVRLLLDNWLSASGPEHSDIDPDLVGQASADGSDEIIRLLLAHGVPMDGYYAEGLTPLKAAAYHHHPDTITLLLSLGADIDEDRGAEGSALAYVAEKGDLPMVKFLVARGANVNHRTQHATVLQMSVKHPEIVRFLLRHGAKVDQQ
jgi:ankyrin repeat protein